MKDINYHKTFQGIAIELGNREDFGKVADYIPELEGSGRDSSDT